MNSMSGAAAEFGCRADAVVTAATERRRDGPLRAGLKLESRLGLRANGPLTGG